MANCFVKKNAYLTSHAILLCSLFHFVATFVCQDVFFELEGLHLCSANCTECDFFKSCMSCTDSPSGSKCKVRCQIGCAVILISNGTLLKDCVWFKGGTRCCITCPPYELCSSCLDFQGVCTSCSDEMYSVRTGCDKQCGHCKSDSKGRANCDSNTGFCSSACEDGYFGQGCDRTCNTDCFESATNSIKCDKLSGNCTFGTGICSKTCLNNVCNRKSGTCSEGCITGWYGKTCQDSCNENCRYRSCIRHSGHCDKGCVHRWFGDTCKEVCSSTCINRTCNQISGYCDSGCLPGRYGNTCKEVCSSTCIKKTCNQISGNCDNGCLPGFYGLKCDVTCSSSCINRTCDRLSGHCSNGCSPGYYGDTCTNVCNAACLNNTCDQLSGYCKHGCTFCSNRSCDQLSGSCKHGCIRGWYGNMCENSCSKTCLNRSCYRDTGFCANGCVYGYFGDFCEHNCSERCTFHLCDCQTTEIERIYTRDGVTDKTPNTNQIFAILSVTGISSGAITVLVLCTCAIYFIRKTVRGRRRGVIQSLHAETTLSDFPTNYGVHGLPVNLGATNESIYDEIRTPGDAQTQNIVHTYQDACPLQRPDLNALDDCCLHRQATQSQNEKLLKHSSDPQSKNLDCDRKNLQNRCEVAWPTTHKPKVNSHIQHSCPGSGLDQSASDVSCDENVDESRPKSDGYLHPTI